MALLIEDIRKQYFKELGLGEYNKENIKKFQAKYLARKSDADGIYGTNTDNLLRHVYNVRKYTKNFSPEEFKCECGGKYCSGYPTFMKPRQLINLQSIRSHYGKPMTVTSGIRCSGLNSKLGGSISNSKHLLGQATDFYIAGVTDTLANRKNFIKYAVGLPNTTYIYGNGCNGYKDSGKWRYGSVSAPYMGNAIHYDTSNDSANPPKPSPTPTNGKLVVDGIGGAGTVKRMQQFFATPVDGVIGGQNISLQKKYYPSLIAVKGGSGGSPCIKNLQRWVGVSQDGVWGKNTSVALQKKLKVTADGIFGKASMKAFQTYLNTHDKPDYPPSPKPRTYYKVIDVSDWQDVIDWKKVKADGVVGAIIRYADGSTLDKKFTLNMNNAKANGLHVGAYIFSRAKTKAEAEAEATRLFNACKPFNCDMPLYIDLEANGLEKYADTVAQAFLNKIKALGGRGGVYANLKWWNNHLKGTAKLKPIMWLAQYNSTMDYKPASDVGMWQYSSSGSVSGIKGDVDMDKCYVEYWKDAPKPVPPKPTPDKKSYPGTYPSYRLTKNNAKVMSDTCKWAKWIAGFNDFHYGWGADAHHNGCFFCGTQPKSKKNSGIKMWETTYCCNPFTTAAQAHGGGIATQFKLCANGKSWIESNYRNSTQYDNLGKPDKSKLKAGDVLCCKNGHVMLYIGDGKIAEAANGDDNKPYSTRWNDSIAVHTLSNDRWNNRSYGVKVVFRYKGNVDCDRYISHGEVSDRVADLQNYLKWYGNYSGSADGIFGKGTLAAVMSMQKDLGLTPDGIVGKGTIEAMKKVKK